MSLRFTDEWVVDRTLFEHVNQGSCSCCGSVHAIMDVAALMATCSDIETDDGRADQRSPWPPFLRGEVWSERVKLRRTMKADMPVYKAFWDEHGREFRQWWEDQGLQDRSRLLSMPVEEVSVQLSTRYDVRGAYSVVLCAANEQIKHFRETGMSEDSRSAVELHFQEALKAERGSYTVAELFVSSPEGEATFLKSVELLGGLKLLPARAARSELAASAQAAEEDAAASAAAACLAPTTTGLADEEPAPGDGEDDGDEKGSGGGDGDGGETGASESFRADRRLLRLIILRYMADRCIARFNKQRQPLSPRVNVA